MCFTFTFPTICNHNNPLCTVCLYWAPGNYGKLKTGAELMQCGKQNEKWLLLDSLQFQLITSLKHMFPGYKTLWSVRCTTKFFAVFFSYNWVSYQFQNDRYLTLCSHVQWLTETKWLESIYFQCNTNYSIKEKSGRVQPCGKVEKCELYANMLRLGASTTNGSAESRACMILAKDHRLLLL